MFLRLAFHTGLISLGLLSAQRDGAWPTSSGDRGRALNAHDPLQENESARQIDRVSQVQTPEAAQPAEDDNLAVSEPSQAGTIVGSKHDFSQADWSQRQICLPCHTPHSAAAPQMAPLWDRSAIARESYTLYDGSTGLLGPASLVCLSCHDGSMAVDVYSSMSGEAFIQETGTGRAVIGGKGYLRGDHPIGVEYPGFDRRFRALSLIEAEGYVVLPQGRVECLSCHDVHNQYGAVKFLVKSNERGALCLTCHRK